jgi:hypothetical protein
LNYNPNPNLSAALEGRYNFSTQEGSATGRLAYNNPGSDTSIYGSFSAKTNGETQAAVGVRIGDQGAPGQLDLSRSQQQLDSSLVDIKIAQLQGKDRELYDQSLAHVTRLNKEGANLPPREAALTIAAMADTRNYNAVGDVRVVPGSNGQPPTYWVGNGSLDNEASKSFSATQQQLTTTPAQQNLSELTGNNMIRQLQTNSQNPTPVLPNSENIERTNNEPSRSVGGR